MKPNYVVAADDRPWLVSFLSPELTEVATALRALPDPDACSVTGNESGTVRPLTAAEEGQLDRLVAGTLVRGVPSDVSGTKWALPLPATSR